MKVGIEPAGPAVAPADREFLERDPRLPPVLRHNRDGRSQRNHSEHAGHGRTKASSTETILPPMVGALMTAACTMPGTLTSMP